MRLSLILASATLMLACGAPHLEVRHWDPSNPVAEVWVDGREAGTVTSGTAVRYPMKPGLHHVSVRAPGGLHSVWHGPPLELVIQYEDAILTLLPDPQPGTAKKKK